VSGFETAIALPEYNLCFDIGEVLYEARQAEYVAITHSHFDHFGAAAKHAYVRGMLGMRPSQFIVPAWMRRDVHDLFSFWAKTQRSRVAPYTVQTLSEESRVTIGNNRYLRSFRTDHRVLSQGCILLEERKRLKPEYRDTPGRELGFLRKKGVEFEDVREVPLVAFTGDTRATIFDTKGVELALQAKVLITECTFLGDVTEAEAVKKGHVHINQLARRSHLFKDVGTVVLSHFSKRYTNAAIEAAIADLPTELREKTTFLPVGK